jgi:hypothetical protein
MSDIEEEFKEFYDLFLAELDHFVKIDTDLTLNLLRLLKTGIDKSISILENPQTLDSFLENPFGENI